MQTSQSGHLLHLYRRKVIATILVLFVSLGGAFAQREYNMPDHDEKPYYFGIILGYNTSHYNITHHPSFLLRDTIQTIESLNSGRVHLGILANWQVTERIDIRGYPLHLIFSEKKFDYREKGQTGIVTTEQRVESIVMSFPLQVRLKSDRIGNFRVYTLAGGKYDFDLASNAGARNSENIVKVRKSDLGVEGGIGFQFFFKYFILSPEIKFSYGITNLHQLDRGLKYSNVLDKLQSRMIVFSIHLED